VPQFRLIDEFGHDLGALVTPAVWGEGDLIPLRHHPGAIVVVRLVEPEPTDDHAGYLVVRPAEKTTGHEAPSGLARYVAATRALTRSRLHA
jgi:hypothetical protein